LQWSTTASLQEDFLFVKQKNGIDFIEADCHNCKPLQVWRDCMKKKA
jgi:hypothetical protein